MKSPCVNVCQIEDDGRCVACGRTRRHVLEWTNYTPEKREQIMESLLKLGYETKNNQK